MLKTMPGRIRSLWRDVASLIWGDDMRWPRAIVGLGSLIWAAHLLLDDDQFGRPAYVYLRQVAPQWAFGAAFAAAGLAQFYRAVRRVPMTKGFYACATAGLIAWLWCAVSIAMFCAYDPPPAMNGGNITVAIVAGLIFIRTIRKR